MSWSNGRGKVVGFDSGWRQLFLESCGRESDRKSYCSEEMVAHLPVIPMVFIIEARGLKRFRGLMATYAFNLYGSCRIYRYRVKFLCVPSSLTFLTVRLV